MGTVVPWKNPDQFKKVYENAYSKNLSKMQLAVEQMTVWETRCWPSLPPAVEATLFLVCSKIQDILFQGKRSLCDARGVEMLYSTSIIRFVNMFVKMDRNTKEKLSMSEVAEKRNIPAWIIDVYNKANRGIFPTLSVFRMAYVEIMQYLEKEFWIPKMASVRCIIKRMDKNSILDVFQDYKAVQIQEVLNKYTRKESYQLSLEAVLKKVESLLGEPDSRKQFLDIVVHPDYFITEEDVIALIKYDEAFIKSEMGVLPKLAQKFWLPIIEILHKHDCIPTFLELLLLSQKKRRNRQVILFQKVADALVLFILNLMIPREESDGIGQSIFFKKGALIDWTKLLYSCVTGSSDFSAFVIQRIKLELDPSSRRCIPDLITNMKIDPDEDRPGRENINVELEQNIWSLAPDTIDFSNLPLGYVFNPVDKE